MNGLLTTYHSGSFEFKFTPAEIIGGLVCSVHQPKANFGTVILLDDFTAQGVFVQLNTAWKQRLKTSARNFAVATAVGTIGIGAALVGIKLGIEETPLPNTLGEMLGFTGILVATSMLTLLTPTSKGPISSLGKIMTSKPNKQESVVLYYAIKSAREIV